MNAWLYKIREKRWTTRLISLVMLVGLALIFSITTGGRFLTNRNIKIIVDQALIVATVATGASFIFATGNTNISMGASTALVATLSLMFFGRCQSFGLTVVVSLVLGVLLMLVSALISTVFHVQIMMVTIVMMLLLNAINQSILGPGLLTLPFDLVAKLQAANFNYIAFGAYFVFSIALFHFTSFGRKLKFIGANGVCAEQTGFSKAVYITLAFLISGIGVGLGAMMSAVRTGSVDVNTASSLNMSCMLAIVLGGMSVFGGSKSFLYAATIGALISVMLDNGLLMLGVDATFLQGVRGVLFFILVCASQERPQGLPAREG
jgi:ribose transport system permease protein